MVRLVTSSVMSKSIRKKQHGTILDIEYKYERFTLDYDINLSGMPSISVFFLGGSWQGLNTLPR